MILRFKKKIKLENQKILDCIDDEDKLYCKENTLLIHNYNIAQLIAAIKRFKSIPNKRIILLLMHVL